MLGSGDAALEHALRARGAAAHPRQVALRLGYDEALAHRIVAGGDVILVPSRFEPCGLTQMYGLRYGSLPLVRRVGGLADTVVDCTLEDLADGAPPASCSTLRRRPTCRARCAAPSRCRRGRASGVACSAAAMAQHFDWDAAAARYLALYRSRGRRLSCAEAVSAPAQCFNSKRWPRKASTLDARPMRSTVRPSLSASPSCSTRPLTNSKRALGEGV